MKKTFEAQKIYLGYLTLLMLSEIQKQISYEMTTTDWHLLQRVATALENGSPYNITAAMHLHTLGSPATLHRALRRLIDAGYIEAKHSESNAKEKLIYTTEKTEELLHIHGKCIEDSYKQLVSALTNVESVGQTHGHFLLK